MKKVMAVALAAIILILILSVSVSAATKPVPGYYVVGTMNNWTLDKSYLMQENSDSSLTLYPVSLTTEDEFKIVYSSDGIHKNIWYPSGVENNITVDEDSDLYELRMAPAGLGVPEEWGGFYFTSEITDAPSVGPEPTVPRDAFKELWESGAKLSAKDIEEAVNDKRQSPKWIFADDITVYNSYRFDCTPAFLVDYELAGGGCYACVILEQITGDYLFTSPSSYEPCIFADNKLYSFTKAYEAGVLTDEMLDELFNANYNSGTEYNNWSLLRNIKGDADGDGEISIIDATVVQRYDVGIMSGVGLYKALADADGDSEVTVTDATVIQRYEAGIIVPGKSEEVDAEREQYREALKGYTADDLFSDNKVIVVLYESEDMSAYNAEVFAAYGVTEVKKLTYSPILILTLDRHDKQNVLKTAYALYELPGIHFVHPDFITKAD